MFLKVRLRTILFTFLARKNAHLDELIYYTGTLKNVRPQTRRRSGVRAFEYYCDRFT